VCTASRPATPAFFFSSRRRHTRFSRDWSSDVCSSDLDAGIDAIMTAHIVVPALDDSGLPATLSKPILTDLLRKEMGFDGLIITDSLGMSGAKDRKAHV